MRKLMAIFAHPDDEGAIASTLAYYAHHETEVSLVCATKGEVGGISDPALATRETLGEVRAAELRTACDILGVGELRFLGYRDSGMENTAENNDPRALVQANPEKMMGQLVGLMRELKPDVVITFEPFGWYGHPDHKIMNRWVTAAYPLVGDASAYPDMGQPWQPKRLFYSVLPLSKFQVITREAKEAGILEDDNFDESALIPQLETEAQVTHQLDLHEFFDRKRQAISSHRTQFDEEHFFRKMPKEMMLKVWGEEYFIQAYPAPAADLQENHQSDLFAA